jgi:hypothetical protein
MTGHVPLDQFLLQFQKLIVGSKALAEGARLVTQARAVTLLFARPRVLHPNAMRPSMVIGTKPYGELLAASLPVSVQAGRQQVVFLRKHRTLSCQQTADALDLTNGEVAELVIHAKALMNSAAACGTMALP